MSDDDTITPYNINTLYTYQEMNDEYKESRYQADDQLNQYQALQTNMIRIVWYTCSKENYSLDLGK